MRELLLYVRMVKFNYKYIRFGSTSSHLQRYNKFPHTHIPLGKCLEIDWLSSKILIYRITRMEVKYKSKETCEQEN